MALRFPGGRPLSFIPPAPVVSRTVDHDSRMATIVYADGTELRMRFVVDGTNREAIDLECNREMVMDDVTGEVWVAPKPLGTA